LNSILLSVSSSIVSPNYMYFDLITEQINDDDDDDVAVTNLG